MSVGASGFVDMAGDGYTEEGFKKLFMEAISALLAREDRVVDVDVSQMKWAAVDMFYSTTTGRPKAQKFSGRLRSAKESEPSAPLDRDAGRIKTLIYMYTDGRRRYLQMESRPGMLGVANRGFEAAVRELCFPCPGDQAWPADLPLGKRTTSPEEHTPGFPTTWTPKTFSCKQCPQALVCATAGEGGFAL